MLWIFFILAALVLYGMLRGGVKLSTLLTVGRYGAYRQLAAEFGGRYEPRGLTDPPTVSFRHRGATVRVGLAPLVPGQPRRPGPGWSIRFDQGIPFRLELTPASRPTPPQPPKGTRAVRVGDASSTAASSIQANDPEMARDFLTAPVRWAVEGLAKLGPAGGMLVSINPERMLVQVDRNLGQVGKLLSAAVREALVIHDGLQAGVMARLAEGVAIVAAGPRRREDAGPPICKVCGDLIGDAPWVTCTTCLTPHHRDCWEFIGACSIFGCQGKSPGRAWPPRRSAELIFGRDHSEIGRRRVSWNEIRSEIPPIRSSRPQ